jgi:hypothetical protein
MVHDELHALWIRAGSDDISEAEAFELLALDKPEITAALAINSSTPPLVLAAISDAGGPEASAARSNSNSPTEVRGLSPIGSLIDEAVWRYGKAKGATTEQLEALMEELYASPRPGGLPLHQVWEQVISIHPRR